MARKASQILTAPELAEKRKALRAEVAKHAGDEKAAKKSLADAEAAHGKTVKAAEAAFKKATKEAEKALVAAKKTSERTIKTASKAGAKVAAELAKLQPAPKAPEQQTAAA